MQVQVELSIARVHATYLVRIERLCCVVVRCCVGGGGALFGRIGLAACGARARAQARHVHERVQCEIAHIVSARRVRVEELGLEALLDAFDDLVLVEEAHLVLGRMDVDVHVVGVHAQTHVDERVGALGHVEGARGLQALADGLTVDEALVDEENEDELLELRVLRVAHVGDHLELERILRLILLRRRRQRVDAQTLQLFAQLLAVHHADGVEQERLVADALALASCQYTACRKQIYRQHKNNELTVKSGS